MIRKTNLLRIVPQSHAMMPHHCKIRGHLYRPSRLNFYCRLASTTRHQRSNLEEFLYTVGLNPDVSVTFMFVVGLAILGLMYGYSLSTYTLNSHKNRQYSGALNTSERFQRNADMQRIFDNHSKRAQAISEDRGVPIRESPIPTGLGYMNV